MCGLRRSRPSPMPLFRRLGIGVALPYRSPIRIKARPRRGRAPSALSGPENLRFHAASKCFGHKPHGFQSNPLMVRGMGGKGSGKPDPVGARSGPIRLGGCSNPITGCTPYSNWSSKEPVRIKGNLVPHQVVCCPAEFVSQGAVCDGEPCLGCLAIVVRLNP